MKKQTSDTTPRAVAMTGDEELTREWTALLESFGITVIHADDHRALAHAGAQPIVAAMELTVSPGEGKKTRLAALDAHLAASVPLISSSVCVTALTQSQWVTHPARLIGFSGFPTFSPAPLIDLAPTMYTSQETVRATRALFASLEKDTVCVQDRTGMIVPAVIAQTINEALMAVQQNVATAHDIDAAMKLGAGYPMGPIEWGEKIGFASIAALLDARRGETGEERWRTCALLRQLAVVGTFWRTDAHADASVQEELPLDASPKESNQSDTHTKKKRGAKEKKNEK